MKINEVTSQAQTSDKLRIDALKRQKDSLNKNIKTTKARAKISQGQRQLQAALSSPN